MLVQKSAESKTVFADGPPGKLRRGWLAGAVPLLRKAVHTLCLQCNSTKMPGCVYPILTALAVDGEVVRKPVCILLGPVLCLPPALLAFGTSVCNTAEHLCFFLAE